ncbi:preprotein translocase subunit YidC [Burkholderiales bacterium JOSHI_001]|nr:preprotein translocase subunit YidC [Burkholderiales bacterium JOSHI_001]
MTDMRRTLLWGVFLMSLFFLWDNWNKHNGRPSMFAPPARVAPAASGPANGTAGGVPTVPATPGAAGTAAAAPAVAAAPASGVAPTSEKVTVTTDLVKATFDTQGGTLVRLELLKYSDAADAKTNVVLLDNSAQRVYLAQTGLAQAGLVEQGLKLPNHRTVMTLTTPERELKDGANELQLRFESPVEGGVKLVKTYTLRRGDYAVGVRHELSNSGSAAVNPYLYLRLVRDGNPPPGESSFYSTFTGGALYTKDKAYQKVDFKDIEKGKAEHVNQADNGWVGIVQHYFASAWLVNTTGPRTFRTEKAGDNLYAIDMTLPLGEVAPGATKAHDAVLYAGPQEEKKLEALAPGLELVKDYGFLVMLSKPLFWLLHWLHGVIGNWGWAIVALVVLLRIAFFWLNMSAYRSMAKMKAINPRVMELRERYKDKPQQMQQEMMRIYREEKVNPLGGCLPIFIQMPFFMALYWVLMATVEMRGAPWIGWIHDLSTKDPFFILPVLMTLSTLVQTWLNPPPPDPVQAKMMWIMPLAFSVMFFFFPAGLVLYWLTNNLLGIAQQWYINKTLGVTK